MGPGPMTGPPPPRRSEGGWDYSIVQSYLPSHVTDRVQPATPRSYLDRPPLPSVPELAQLEREYKATLPPSSISTYTKPGEMPGTFMPDQEGRLPGPLQDYTAPEERRAPATQTGQMVRVIDAAERTLGEYQKAEQKVAEAGQGKYVPWQDVSSLQDVTYNIGQWNPAGQEWVGKGLTALGQSALVTGAALGEPARWIEKEAFGAPTPVVRNLVEREQITGNPTKEKALDAALGLSYSGPQVVEKAYKEALALEQLGALTPENVEKLHAKHGSVWAEMGGRAVFDPMLWADVMAGGLKTVRYSKQIAGATDMFIKPVMALDDAGKATKNIASTATIINSMERATTRSGQASAAEDLLHVGLSYINPRYKASEVHRTSERIVQTMNYAGGIANKRAVAQSLVKAKAAGLAADTPEFAKFMDAELPAITRRAADDFQQAAALWAGTAADNVDDATKAANQLTQLGYGDVPSSMMGRQTGVVLRRLMEKPNGEMGDLMTILKVNAERGLPVENVAEALYTKTAKVLDDIMPQQGWETGAVHTAIKKFPLLGTEAKVRKGADKFFGAVFMGLNPGYAMRNMYDNTGRMFLMGYSPLTKGVDLEQKFGMVVQGAKRGVGAAGEKTGMPFHRLASWGETRQGGRVVRQAYMDVLGRLESAALKNIPDLSPQAARFAKNFLHQDITYIDRLASGTHNLSAWQLLDNDTVLDALTVADPLLNDHVLSAITKAATPEDAITAIRGLQKAYVSHTVKVAEAMKPAGPLKGTVTGQAADLISKSGKQFRNFDNLTNQLSGVEHAIANSRAKAVESIVNAVNPEKWHAVMLQAEALYDDALKTITQRQVMGYSKLVSGKIDEATYSKHLLDIYSTAYRDLDGQYSNILNGVLSKTEVEHTPEQLLRWAVHREAIALDPQDYASAVLRGALPDEAIKHPLYIQGTPIPSAHFGNKVRQLLREGGIPNDRVLQIKKVEDMAQEELLVVINGFKRLQLERAGITDFIPATLDDVLAQARVTAAPGVFGQAPKAIPALPEGGDVGTWFTKLSEQRDVLFDQIDELKALPAKSQTPAIKQQIKALQRQADALDDQVDQLGAAGNELELLKMMKGKLPPAAKQTMQEALDETLHTGPTGLGAATSTSERATAALNGVIDDIMRKVNDPPLLREPLISQEEAQALRTAYSNSHMTAAEVARRSRDHTLLDYEDRRSLDGILKFVFPWHYWYSRSMPNWAMAVAGRPIVTAKYMESKKLLREHNAQNPDTPQWAQDQIAFRVPGVHGTMFLDYDAAFNSVSTIYDTFEDPDKSKDAFGNLLQKMSIGGPAIHPMLLMAYAAERSFLQGDTEALRSYGYLTPQTKVFANLTGKQLEPWLWSKDPITGEVVPLSGGTKWDIEKGVRKMAYEQSQGRFGPEEAIFSAATHSGAPMTQMLVNDIPEYRRWPMMLSSILGLRTTYRADWENEIAAVSNQYSVFKDAGQDREARTLLSENPWLATMWMSWDNDAARTKMLANNVLARVGPMPGKNRDALLQSVGLNPELMEMFYAGKGDKQSLTDWEKPDYDQFSRGIFSLAKTLSIPDKQTAQAWNRAKESRSALEEQLAQQFPQASQQEAVYYHIKKTQGDDAAKEYLNQPGIVIKDFWNAEMHAMLKEPTMLEFYAGPAKIDVFATSLMFEQMKREFGDNIYELRSQYGAIPDDDKISKREFRLQYPQVTASYDAENPMLRQLRNELSGLREKAGTGPLVQAQPGVTGTTAQQRAVMNVLKDFEFDRSIPVPKPPDPVERFTPQEKAKMKAYDKAVEHAVRVDPEYFNKEREYTQIKKVYGDDAAFQYAKTSGLLDSRDIIKIAKAHMPETLVDMDDGDVMSAAKALMRAEANRMWPGLQDRIEQEYYTIPEAAKSDRRKWRDANPDYRAYMDWKQGAIDKQYTDLLGRRQTYRETAMTKPVVTNQPIKNITNISNERIAQAIGQTESGSNYGAKNPGSSASGKYQYINSTWNNFEGYTTAQEAPPDIQDQRILADLGIRAVTYKGDVEQMIAAHYSPALAGDKSKWGQRPIPTGKTVREYVNLVLGNLK
jgi:hypothetical protein